MDLAIPAAALAEQLAAVLPAASTRSTEVAQDCALLDATAQGLRITTTDSIVQIAAARGVDVRVPGAAAVSAKKLYTIARQSGDRLLQLTRHGLSSQLLLTHPTGRYLLRAFDASEFSFLDQAETTGSLRVAPADFHSAISFVLPAASIAPGQRSELSCVLIDSAADVLNLIAADGHRLAAHPLNVLSSSLPPQLLIPRRASDELMRIASNCESSFELHIQRQSLACQTEREEFASILGAGVYPDVRPYLTLAPAHRIDFATAELIDVLQRALIINDRKPEVDLVLDSRRALLVKTPDSLEEISLHEAGSPVAIRVNATYLLDALKAVLSQPGGDTACLRYDDPMSSICVHASEGDQRARHVIMPVRS